MQVKIRHNPTTLDAIQWNANEPEIREFMGVEDNIRLRSNNALEIWNGQTRTWENVPHLGYILKSRKGGFSVISNEEFTTDYSVVD